MPGYGAGQVIWTTHATVRNQHSSMAEVAQPSRLFPSARSRYTVVLLMPEALSMARFVTIETIEGKVRDE